MTKRSTQVQEMVESSGRENAERKDKQRETEAHKDAEATVEALAAEAEIERLAKEQLDHEEKEKFNSEEPLREQAHSDAESEAEAINALGDAVVDSMNRNSGESDKDGDKDQEGESENLDYDVEGADENDAKIEEAEDTIETSKQEGGKRGLYPDIALEGTPNLYTDLSPESLLISPKISIELSRKSKCVGSNLAFQRILEGESLRFLKTADTKWFYKNFNGDVDEDGYLLDMDGNQTNFLPSQNVTGGWGVITKESIRRFEEKVGMTVDEYIAQSKVENNGEGDLEKEDAENGNEDKDQEGESENLDYDVDAELKNLELSRSGLTREAFERKVLKKMLDDEDMSLEERQELDHSISELRGTLETSNIFEEDTSSDKRAVLSRALVNIKFTNALLELQKDANDNLDGEINSLLFLATSDEIDESIDLKDILKSVENVKKEIGSGGFESGEEKELNEIFQGVIDVIEKDEDDGDNDQSQDQEQGEDGDEKSGKDIAGVVGAGALIGAAANAMMNEERESEGGDKEKTQLDNIDSSSTLKKENKPSSKDQVNEKVELVDADTEVGIPNDIDKGNKKKKKITLGNRANKFVLREGKSTLKLLPFILPYAGYKTVVVGVKKSWQATKFVGRNLLFGARWLTNEVTTGFLKLIGQKDAGKFGGMPESNERLISDYKRAKDDRLKTVEQKIKEKRELEEKHLKNIAQIKKRSSRVETPKKKEFTKADEKAYKVFNLDHANATREEVNKKYIELIQWANNQKHASWEVERIQKAYDEIVKTF